MYAEDKAGQPQDHIVTPVPLPYTARSTAVLRSMMYKELQGNDLVVYICLICSIIQTKTLLHLESHY